MRPRDNNDYKLDNCYNSCLVKVLTNNIRFIVFCCLATGIYGFDQRKAAEMALATVRLWLESNGSSVDCINFCLNENKC